MISLKLLYNLLIFQSHQVSDQNLSNDEFYSFILSWWFHKEILSNVHYKIICAGFKNVHVGIPVNADTEKIDDKCVCQSVSLTRATVFSRSFAHSADICWAPCVRQDTVSTLCPVPVQFSGKRVLAQWFSQKCPSIFYSLFINDCSTFCQIPFLKRYLGLKWRRKIRNRTLESSF